MSDEPNQAATGLNRREFFKASALGAGAAVALSGCGGGEERLIPLLVPEDRLLPGVDQWTPSSCPLCPASCGIEVRSMLGEAKVLRAGREFRQMIRQVKKIEGNPRHPINRGRLCARGQAGPQILYNPDRVSTPLKLSGPRGSGHYQSISWEEALAILDAGLKPAVSRGMAAICGFSTGQRPRLMRDFLTLVGSNRCYVEEPAGLPTIREANRRMFGRAEPEVHDLENADYLLSFGANLLESHTSPVRYNLGLSHFRRGRPGRRGKFVQVESRFSLTAANADEWLPARPGSEALVALAMAWVILKEDLYDKSITQPTAAAFEEFRSWVLGKYAPEKVAQATDIPAGRLIRVAREFARHQPGIALAGGSSLAQSHGLFTALAVQALNALVGNVRRKGGVTWTASSAEAVPPQQRQTAYWADDFVQSAQSLQSLILWDANPLYNTPPASGVRQSLERIPFIVSFSVFENESSAYADLILPDRTFLERWDLIEPETTVGSRVLSLTQPIVNPMYESQDCADIILKLAARWGGSYRETLPDESFRDYLKRALSHADVLRGGSFAADDIDSFWDKFVAEGVWVDSASESPRVTVSFSAVKAAEPPPAGPASDVDYPYHLVPFVSAAVGTGREANIPWLQEMPDPMTSVVWGSWVEMNPKTAAALGVRDNEWVWVESPSGRIRVASLVTPTARPDTLSIPFGQGHTSYGRYASSRGANPWEVLLPTQVRDCGEPAWAATRVKVVGTGERASIVRIGYDRERTPAELKR